MKKDAFQVGYDVKSSVITVLSLIGMIVLCVGAFLIISFFATQFQYYTHQPEMNYVVSIPKTIIGAH
jgi:hypothetical protein